MNTALLCCVLWGAAALVWPFTAWNWIRAGERGMAAMSFAMFAMFSLVSVLYGAAYLAN